MKTHYGISGDEYQLLVDVQGGVCAICGKPETVQRRGRTPSLSVDHDHVTGKVRGLLCDRCNHGIGLFKEDTTALANAIVYLKRGRA